MESIDTRVLRELRDWRAAGSHALLATVVMTWGSSPRPVGAMMALREDGRAVGSVSGGCIEDDLIARYTRTDMCTDTCTHTPTDTPTDTRAADRHAIGMRAMPPQLVRYGVNADEAHRFGLPCGGTLELLLEFDPQLEALEAAVKSLESGELVRRTVCCNDGSVSLERADTPEALCFDGERLSATLGPEYRMLLIGAGALAEYLATMALFNGFAVTVCDPRAEYLDAWSVAGVRTIVGMPDDVVVAFQPDQRSCIVALSHDPKLDDLALLEALHSPVFYLGAIGSRRNDASRRERLITHFGETTASLERLRSPVGLYIGSKTPAEIAVSVMAEIIAVKNRVRLPSEMSVACAKQLDREAA